MIFTPPKIYPVTDTRLSGLTHAEQAERLIAGGATLIQLREKYLSPRSFYEAASAAVGVARSHGVTVIINDRVDIALALGTGVHLGQDDMPPEKAREMLGPAAIIGFSTHDLGQARLAAALPVDYVAIGPIFATRTKEDPDAVVGLDEIRRIREAIGTVSLVAIGGIDESNVISVLAAGADSAAIVGSIAAAGDIEGQMRRLVALTSA